MAARKKVARKTSGKTSKKATARKAAARKTQSAEQRYRLIEQAAYFLAEGDGFRGDPVGYWIEAEKQVDASRGG